MYTRLNHLNTCLSYPATIRVLTEISKFHVVPIQNWIAEDATFKFVGDNVDKQITVRDVRSDHQSHLLHMYSILAVRSRLPNEDLSKTGTVSDLSSIAFKEFLPSHDDLQVT